jgi:hypothetical protein
MNQNRNKKIIITFVLGFLFMGMWYYMYSHDCRCVKTFTTHGSRGQAIDICIEFRCRD